MSLQLLIVILCVLVAIGFMSRKFYRTVKNRGGCSCDCDGECKTRECGGGAPCGQNKNLREIKPK